MPTREKEKGNISKLIGQTVLFFLPYWLLSFLIIFIIFAVVAVVFIITPLSQATFPFISCFCFAVVELAVSYLLGRFCKMPAVLSGIIYGAGLALIMLIIGLVTASLSLFSLKFLFLLITGSLIGIFGTIAEYTVR